MFFHFFERVFVVWLTRFFTTVACQRPCGGPICPYGVQLGLDLPLSGGLAGLSEPVCGTVFLSFVLTEGGIRTVF